MHKLFLFMLSLLAWSCVSADDIVVQTHDPRPFGYVIGDELMRRIEIDAPLNYAIQNDSLPRAGRVDAWLELRKIKVTQKSLGDKSRHTLDLHYQIMNSPENVKTHQLPKLLIIFNNLESAHRTEIAESPFTVAPITPAFVLARAGLVEMQPDKSAPLISATARYWRLSLAALLALAAVLSLVYVKWGLPFLRKHNGPFARAAREIKKIGEADRAAALRRLHRAFDETAGAAIFPQHLPEFFTRHPSFNDVQNEAEQFFAASRGQFFSTNVEGGQTINAKWLLNFCARCRDRERGLL